MLYPSVDFIPLLGGKVVEDRRIRHQVKKSALFVCPPTYSKRTSENLFTNQLTIKKMKKLFVLLLCTAALASCNTTSRITPNMVNTTINTVRLVDLHLTRGDYEILNTIESEAIVEYEWSNYEYNVKVSGDDFSVRYIRNGNNWNIMTCSGILKLGYLSGDQINDHTLPSPEDIGRHLAIYRLINIAKQSGGDAVIEPTIATSCEQTKENTVVYKTIVTAKLIKIKTNR